MHPRPAAARYDVIPLPFIPFSDTGGEALNSEGAVAGGIAHSDGSVSLASWCKGVLSNLGVPPGAPSAEFSRPRVFGMNGSGAIVGTVHTPAGNLPSRWFIYERGRFTVLPLADSAGLGGAAIGINQRGDVVGYTHTATNNLIGWLWSNGAYSRLPVSGTSTAALGINSSGTVVGNRTPRLITRLLSGALHPAGELGYVVSQGTTRYLSGFVYALNDLDEAVGGSLSAGVPVATLYKGGVATVILRLPSAAVGINSSAEVVGHYDSPRHKRRRLFRWSADFGALDLTPDDYHSAQAAAINDRGEILGFGETAAGRSEYFLLTPDPEGKLTPTALASAAAAL